MTASAFAEDPGLARDSPRSPFLEDKDELVQEPSSARSLSRSASGRLPSLFRQVSAHDITLAELDGEAQDGSETSSLPGTPRRALLRLTSRAQSFSLEPVPEAEALAVVAPGTPSEAAATAEEQAVPEPLTAEETRESVFFLDGAEASTEEFARHAIVAEELDDNFYVYDMSVIQKNYAAWVEALPRVQPFYAVKCNPDASMLAVLAALGTGFDCASQGEIEKVLSLGVSPDRIVYAHPCKPPRQIRFAAENGINLTTVDTASELHKIAQLHPRCGLLIRIRADDITAVCQLGNKFGVEVDEEAELLQIVKELGLDVRGVSFHVGSGAKDPTAFRLAIEHARKVFDLGKELGYEMNVLDLGGGFTGGSLQNVRDVINATLDECFPADGNVRIIAEPGRYFAEPAATYFCSVIGYRERKPKNGAEQEMHYFLSDGIYGSMNCILYDHIKLDPKPFRSPLLPEVSPEEEAHTIKSTFFGPTCDGLDTFCPDVRLPRLRNGDFVCFPRFGAYTLAGATNFNGFEVVGAKCFYFYAN